MSVDESKVYDDIDEDGFSEELNEDFMQMSDEDFKNSVLVLTGDTC